MPPLHIHGDLLDQVVDQIASCGAGRRECVVYVTGPVDAPNRATGFIHPHHQASAVSITVGPDELDSVWDKLRRHHQRIVLQVHSHPGGAHHSGVDDRWPVVHRTGFLSLVLARFGHDRLDGAHLAAFLGDGQWAEVNPDAWDSHLVIEPAHQPRIIG